jgi:hypothetical protein
VVADYTIPFITEDKARQLREFSEQFGAEANLQYRRESDWSLTCVARLPSALLKKEIRDIFGLDRYRLKPVLTAERKEFLQTEIPEITIETETSFPNSNLVTFPASERNKELVEVASNDEKWCEHKQEESKETPPPTVQSSEVKQLVAEEPAKAPSATL